MNIYQEITAFYQSVKTEKRIIGTSLLGRNLYAVKVGDGSPVGIATYAIHGREFITAKLARVHYYYGVKGTLWLVPLVNPDGALLSEVGRWSARGGEYDGFLSRFTAEELRLWKANARGVDLNVNFDAEWGNGLKNTRTAGAENYIGAKAFSEPETRALRDFTLRVRPDYTVSYHTKGEEIYWRFHQSAHTCLRDKRLAEVISAATGYPLREAYGSVGGYKDWCILTLGIPSFTVEVGSDDCKHPLGERDFERLKIKNDRALYALSMAVTPQG
ncbi:MAG: hypothetical protein IJX98_04395 [Clostridia bacterium]|nr:hypothetical protein [Clostridia bacterium]